MTDGSQSLREMQAEVFKAIGHPIRLQIVRFLGEGERPVSDIVKAVRAEQSNVSRHLSLLRQAGVLVSRKEGLKVFYRVFSPQLVRTLNGMVGCVNDMVRSRLRANESMLALEDEQESADPP